MATSTQPREIKLVDADATTVSCDGGGGPLGHPRVYLPFDGRSYVDCYYCSQRFARPGYETPGGRAEG